MPSKRKNALDVLAWERSTGDSIPRMLTSGPMDAPSPPVGVQYKDLQVGQGESVSDGDVAVMHFVGWLAQDDQRGREIFNTRNRGEPVSFVVGTEKVMPGWNVGVLGMRAGGRRLLLVPPGLAYGHKGVPGVVPADAPLMFLSELVSVKKAE